MATEPTEGKDAEPPPFSAVIEEACRKLRAEWAAHLIHHKSLAGLCQVAESALRTTETLVAQIPEPPASLEVKSPLACAAGCSACCRHGIIGTTPIQALYAAVTARRRLSHDDFHAIRLRTLAERRPCPLLVEDRCVLYDARPLVCRVWFSYDLALCQARTFNQVPAARPVERAYHQHVFQIHTAVDHVLAQTMADHAVPHPAISFSHGLLILFTQPDAVERWLNGDAVFANAQWAPS